MPAVADSLKRKVGPLPAYGWIVIAVAAIGVIIVLRRRNQTTSVQPLTSTGAGSPTVDPTTGLPYAGAGSAATQGSTGITDPGYQSAPNIVSELSDIVALKDALTAAGLIQAPSDKTPDDTVHPPPVTVTVMQAPDHSQPAPVGERAKGVSMPPLSVSPQTGNVAVTGPGLQRDGYRQPVGDIVINDPQSGRQYVTAPGVAVAKGWTIVGGKLVKT